MGRSDYNLGKIQLIFWIPRSLQNFWKCHHGGCVLYFITLVRLVTSSRAFCSLWVHLVCLSLFTRYVYLSSEERRSVASHRAINGNGKH